MLIFINLNKSKYVVLVRVYNVRVRSDFGIFVRYVSLF